MAEILPYKQQIKNVCGRCGKEIKENETVVTTDMYYCIVCWEEERKVIRENWL